MQPLAKRHDGDSDGIKSAEQARLDREYSLRHRYGSFAKLASESWRLLNLTPKWLGTVSTVAFLSAAIVYGASLGGHLGPAVDAASKKAGLAITEVHISGQASVSESEILSQLGITPSTSLIAFNVADARDRLLANPWISSVTVQKFYPGTLRIAVTERRPFAVWQRGSLLSVVDQAGEPIIDVQGGDFASLPLIVGRGAQREAEGLFSELVRYPLLQSRLRASSRIADRRWNLHLDTGTVVLLPEEGLARALRDLDALARDRQILARDISRVDLRFADKVTLRLTDDAATERKAAFEAAIKRRKTGGDA
ncbi:cell division protein FtsQ/DivIB [Coralliovum pocilloporae]|uniref:cell division protein FtsQ/DivIB n=1 Tax=Coralliovum pocilloporae TaxID=3066369 RepID=UPI00330774EB